MSQYVKVNGVLRSINKEYAKVGGTLRSVTQKYVKVNGILRNLYNRDFSKNTWTVLSSNSEDIPSVGSITNINRWVYSRYNVIVKVVLQSTMEFLRGDVFNITFKVDTDEEDNPDAQGQGASIIVRNSNNSSNNCALSGSSPSDDSVNTYTGTLTLTQNGCLKAEIELESCGDGYFSVCPAITIKGNNL